jgi:hypothetical protein
MPDIRAPDIRAHTFALSKHTSSESRMQLLPKRDPACVSHCVHVCVRNLESYVRMGHNRLVQTWLKTITIALSHNRLCLTIFVGSIAFVFLLQRDIFFPRLPPFVTPFLFAANKLHLLQLHTVGMSPGLLVFGRHFSPRLWALRSQ